jgi:predicted Zn finger-like uncharacterized protein
MAESDQIQCPHCGQTYAVRPEQWPQYSGRSINCTRCGQAFTVAAPPELMAQGQSAPAPEQAAYPQQTPAFPSATPTPGGYGGYPTGGYSPGPTMGNGLAVTSLIFGIFSFCVPVIATLVAVITGIFGLLKTRDPRVGGRGMSIAGIVLGIVGLLPSIFFSFFLFGALLPAFTVARERANEVKCSSNMKQLGLAMMMYANTNSGHFPDKLEDVLQSDPSLPRTVFVCPSDDKTPPSGTSAQAAAHGISSGKNCSYIYVGNELTNTARSDSVLLYEPLADHHRGMNVLFADGTVRWLASADAQKVLAQQNSGTRPIKVDRSMGTSSP